MSADMSKATAPSRHFVDAVEIVTEVLKGNWPLAEMIVRKLEPLHTSERAELLAALRGVRDAWEGKSGMGTMFEMPRAVCHARAALAKAEERR